MQIGHNLRRERDAKGWSQDIFAKMAGMSQSNLSNIESNKQDVTWGQIELFAKILEISPENLTRQDAPVFNSHHQQGGQANNYIVQNGMEGEIAALKDQIRSQEEEIRFLRQQVQKMTDMLSGQP